VADEIATAYVSLTPSFRGGAKAIADEFDGPAEDAGKQSGERFGDGFGSALKGALGVAVLAVGGSILASAFDLAIQQADLPGIMRNQFGLTEAAAAESAEVAGDVYAAGWGASLGEVGTAVGQVNQQLQALGQTGDVDELTVSAQALADTFDEEVGGVISAAGQLVKTGLVPDMQAGFDVMAAGFQAGLDPADDFLDTITEYSVQFQTLGLDATTAFGLIDQGLQAGARSSDLVADAIKEFAIRAIDGSETTKAGFDAIGLSSEEMAAKIAAGGPEASTALDTVLDRLRAMEDPVARDAAAVALFGTQAEDLNESLYALDPSEASSRLGDVAGAATDVADAAGGGTQAKITALGRAFQDSLANALVTIAPMLNGLLTIISPIAPILGPLTIAVLAIAAAQWVWNTALLASPITWIILGIVALIAGIVLLVQHWDTVAAAMGIAWDWIVQKFEQGKAAVSAIASAIWSWISSKFEAGKALVTLIVRTIVDYFRDRIAAAQGIFAALGELPGKVGAWFQGVYDSAKSKLSSLVDWVKGIPDKIQSALGDLKDLLFNAGKNILEGLLEGIESMVSSLQDKLGGITDMIPDWKGPPERDRDLLTDSGEMIIDSLETGFDNRTPAVRSSLQALTTSLAADVAGSLAGPAQGLTDSDRQLLVSASAGRNQTFNIYDASPDPGRLAAELDWRARGRPF
jgi:hypothetical protein